MDISQPLQLLVIDADDASRHYLKALLPKSYQVHTAATRLEAVNLLKQHAIDIVLLDVGHEELLRTIKQLNEETDIIIMSGLQMVQTVVNALKTGAVDYVTKPFEKETLLLTLQRVAQNRQLQRNNTLLKQELHDTSSGSEIIGESLAIAQIKDMIQRLRGQNVNVFIVGETGTGKEVFARLIHQQENSPSRPFVSVNCAAIPENLLESILFGHEKGAFTGATEKRLGKFELANGGDIFLDEISCLSLDLQAKLLRVIEEKEIERVGGSVPKKVNFRVISACNDNIIQLVAKGLFRKDLFYRLNTVTVQLPPLNSRREDIVPLAEYFLNKYRRTPIAKALSAEVKEILTQHNWRGNVRELKNTIENMLIFSKDDLITVADLPFLVQEPMIDKNGTLSSSATIASSSVNDLLSSTPLTGQYKEIIRNIERQLILRSLERNRWNKSKACKEIGIKRNKLYRKLSELGIDL